MSHFETLWLKYGWSRSLVQKATYVRRAFLEEIVKKRISKSELGCSVSFSDWFSFTVHLSDLVLERPLHRKDSEPGLVFLCCELLYFYSTIEIHG